MVRRFTRRSGTIIFASIAVAFIAIYYILSATIFNSSTLNITDIYSETSPNGIYTVDFQQVGKPDKTFGEVMVKVIISEKDKENGTKVIKTITARLSNYGDSANENNCDIEWSDEKVVITLHSDEKDNQFYEVSLINQ